MFSSKHRRQKKKERFKEKIQSASPLNTQQLDMGNDILAISIMLK